MNFSLCLELGREAEMNMDSSRFALLKRVTSCFFKFCWAYPLICILVCSCGLIGLIFPKVFQRLVSFMLLSVFTYLFLAAFVSARPPQSQSPKAEPSAGEKSAETQEEERHGDRHIENFYVVNWQAETQIAGCHENVETAKEAKPAQKFEDITDISNARRNLLKFKYGEDVETFEANDVQQDAVVLEDKEEKESIPVDEIKFPLGLGIEEEPAAQEEENDRKHGFLSSEGEEEEEEEGRGGNDIGLESSFSGWKSRFESSSDSLSEASSLGDLGHLFDDLDPLLLTDEEEADGTNASAKAHEDEYDRPLIWPAEDEGLFDLGHHHYGSESESMFSEDDNLIEIEISKTQVLDDNKKKRHDQRNYLGGPDAEEPNLIDLDYSQDDRLQGQNLTDYLWEEGGASAIFPEEENLIEIDLSADTIVVPPAANEDKVSPIHISARKKVPSVDLLIDELHDGRVSKISLPCVPTATVVDLIDLNSLSILEMNMLGSEDEQSKPEKTESIRISITKKIQDHSIANLLD